MSGAGRVEFYANDESGHGYKELNVGGVDKLATAWRCSRSTPRGEATNRPFVFAYLAARFPRLHSIAPRFEISQFLNISRATLSKAPHYQMQPLRGIVQLSSEFEWFEKEPDASAISDKQ